MIEDLENYIKMESSETYKVVARFNWFRKGNSDKLLGTR
jgi:hypothetical protein